MLVSAVLEQSMSQFYVHKYRLPPIPSPSHPPGHHRAPSWAPCCLAPKSFSDSCNSMGCRLPGDFPGKNAGVGREFSRNLPDPGIEPTSPALLSHQRSPALPMSHGSFSLAICFTHGSVMCPCLPLLPPLCPHVHSLHLHLYSCSANRFICTIF